MTEAIRANGWRQGSIVAPSDHPAIQQYAPCSLAARDCCIVLSQSCDVVCRDLEAEPIVEIVLASRLNSPADGNYTHAKNARRLHFHIVVNGNLEGYEAHIRSRFSIPRSLLQTVRPDVERAVRPLELSEIISWILARYDRVAFPDEFNSRIAATVAKKIKPALEKLTRMKSIYVGLNTWDELPADQKYSMTVLGTLQAEDFEQPEIRQAMEQGLSVVAAALHNVPGIVVEDFTVLSEADVTLDLVRTLARWNFDYISLRDPSAHVLPRQGT